VLASSTPARACLSSSSAPWSQPTVAAATGCRAREGGRVPARGGRRVRPTAAHAQRRRLRNRGLRLGLRTEGRRCEGRGRRALAGAAPAAAGGKCKEQRELDRGGSHTSQRAAELT
jgi:hypothetical protein